MRAPRVHCRLSMRVLLTLLLLAACAAYCYYTLPSWNAELDLRKNALPNQQLDVKSRILVPDGESKHGAPGVDEQPTQCPLMKESQADIDTVTTFPTFDFQPSWIHSMEFWDEWFETRYERSLNDTTRPPLEVIVIPHSHTDPGWLKTFHQYSELKTRDILNSALYQLKKHPDLTFIWTEIAFLDAWWQTAHPVDRKAFKRLVERGQLEIMTGGWVMPDEACTHYYSLVDQLIEGHMWVKDKLGISPKNGWSIDPFGHGPTVPYLLERSGLTGAVIQRIHYAWKQYLAKKRVEDFHWLPGFETRADHRLLVHNMPFDIYSIQGSCGPHPSVCMQFDFAMYGAVGGGGSGAPEALYAEYARTGSLTDHNVVLIPVGDDFRYNTVAEFEAQYSNYKRLFGEIRRMYGDKVSIKFGTPQQYFDAVRARTKRPPTIRGDMFVYSDIFSEARPAYWSGYFTTRPAVKLLARYLLHHLRAAHILYSYAYNTLRQHARTDVKEITKRALDRTHDKLVAASRNLALFQHHDAITGTSKAFVMHDYGTRLVASLYDSQRAQELAVDLLMVGRAGDGAGAGAGGEVQSVDVWDRYGGMPRKQRAGKGDRLIVFNSVLQARTEIVHLQISSPRVRVTHVGSGRRVTHQINPVFLQDDHRHRIRISNDTFELLFLAELPPLTAVTYIVEANVEDNQKTTVFCEGCGSEVKEEEEKLGEGGGEAHFDMSPLLAADVRLENSHLELVVDRNTGFLRQIYRKDSEQKHLLQIEFGAYQSAQRSSGAYLFKPEYAAPERDLLKDYAPEIRVRIVSGALATELHTLYPPLLHHTLRIYHVEGQGLERGVLLTTTLDLEPPPKNRETEVFMRLHSDLDNGEPPVMYTDQNGFQYQKRVKVESLGIEANYYPVTTMAWIEDAHARLSLLTGHAQGAAAARVGQLELMLDRRTLYDDRRGLGEGVVDNVPTRMQHWLLIEPSPPAHGYRTPSQLAERLSRSLQFPPITYTVEQDQGVIMPQLALANNLPSGLHLLSLRVLGEYPTNSVLMTLHRPAPNDHGLCPPVVSNGRFEKLSIKQIAEVSLTGLHTFKNISSLNEIRLEPMEIKSYQIWF